MQHVVDSRSGQHVGSRDYTPGFEYFTVADGGGADGGRQAGAAHSAHCHGAGWAFAAGGGAGRWHGASDAARLGYSLQRRWADRLADRPPPGPQPRLTEAPRCEVAKGVKTALTARPMAWCAGAGPTCVPASPPNSMFNCMS